MNALEIALAIGVSMLIFSTLATMVMEIVIKLSRMRATGLKKMLERFYMDVVQGRMRAVLSSDTTKTERKSAFVEKMTAMTEGSHTLSTIEFIRRLADTKIGRRLARHAGSRIDVLIHDITERYEDYGRQASQLFRRKSQTGTVIVSILIALFLNINVVTLFNTFQSNEKLTRTVANQAENAMEFYQAQAEQLKALQAAPPEQMSTEKKLQSLNTSIQKLKQAVADAEQLGLPIGWTDNKLFNLDDIKPNGFLWLLSTVFTGLLIGLGGPFWFDIVKRLTLVRQVTGALVRQPPAKSQTGDEATAPKEGTAAVPQDPVAAFKTVLLAGEILGGRDPGTKAQAGPYGLQP